MRKHAELIKQWLDDESLVVEIMDSDGLWTGYARPSFHPSYNYRIKPKAEKKVEMWQWALMLKNNDVTPKQILASQFYKNIDFVREEYRPDHWQIICRIEGSRIEVEE